MKTTITFWILGLLLLGLSCKKPVEPAGPVVPTDLPPLVWNDPCRISRIVYKTIIDQGFARDPEQITVDGKTFRIGINMETHYIYDSQGRLVREIFNEPGDSLFNTYSYTATNIYSYSVPVRYDGKRIPRRDTVKLDKRGLAERDFYDQFYFEYDANGYPIKNTFWNKSILGLMKIEQGNTVLRENASGTAYGTFTWLTMFDLTKQNLPVIKRFLGRDSKNLPIREITTIRASTYYPNGDVYQIDHSYKFDAQGRVKRRISYGKALNPNWVFANDPEGLGVTDYEYECQ